MTAAAVSQGAPAGLWNILIMHFSFSIINHDQRLSGRRRAVCCILSSRE